MLLFRKSVPFSYCLKIRFYSAQIHEGRKILQKAIDGYSDIKFMPLRLRDWNASPQRGKFSYTYVDVVQYLKDDIGIREPFTVSQDEILSGRVKTHLVPFYSIFYNGFEALRKSLDGRTDLLDVDLAANALVTSFLNDKDYHEECLQNVLETGDKNEISVLLANHLFSRFTASRGLTYFVTDDMDVKWKECPCALRCGEKIIYDNTGFGSEHLWFGRPDIMVFPMGGIGCGVIVPKSPDDDDTECESEERMAIDMATDKHVIRVEGRPPSLLRGDEHVKQITAFAIAFAMYQKKQQKEMFSNMSSNVSLIPIVAASGDCFDIYMYDSECDIFLRNAGNPIPLWSDNVNDPSYAELNLSSILQLWMVMNYISVKPSLNMDDTKMLTGTCGFVSKLSPDLLGKIEKSLRKKKKFRDIKEKEFYYELLKLSGDAVS